MFRNTTAEIISLVGSNITFSDIHLETDQYAKIFTPSGWIDAPAPDKLPVLEGDGSECHSPEVLKAAERLPLFHAEDIDEFLSDLDAEWKEQILSRKFKGGKKALDLHCCRLRLYAYSINNGKQIAVDIRRLPLEPMPIDKTGLPMYIRTVLTQSRGLIIVTGQTCSGKTTTLASMVDYINQTQEAHILTIEDPIEYVHSRKKSIITPREVPTDVPSFAEGMKEAMRQKPTVILVGEIRDRETAEVAFLLAESGHLVLCSLHTNSATGAINKLMAMFARDELHQRALALSETLIMVITQNLIPTINRKGFVLASEIMMNNSQVAKLLVDPTKHKEIRQVMERSGPDDYSQTMQNDLLRLVTENKITTNEALRFTPNRQEFQALMQAKHAQR